MSQTFEFRMARTDWVALSTAVARRPLAFRIATVVAMASLVAMVLAFLSAPDGGTLLASALAGGADWYPFYGIIALFAVALLFRHRLIGFNAAAGFARLPLADKLLVVDAEETDVHVVAPDFDWRFPWAAVFRLIETPTHLVIATGGREGLPVPRRAFADAAAFEAFRAFVVAHLPEEASHERS
ncbi:YcxB family protein [Siculibacillus lacustris]|nr:YcxB family protein [Siculibacillus lacustris]